MAFFEVEFPRKNGIGITGGPTWSTLINAGFSGFEQRNKNWANTRNEYQLDLVAQPQSVFQTVLDFFLAVNGKGDAFRFHDPTDFKATGVATSPSAGDGNNKIFQLQQTYTIGTGAVQRTYTRSISKPVYTPLPLTGSPATQPPLTDFQGNTLANTVNVYLNGVLKTNITDYTVDATTGLISFVVAPGANVAVTADCQYHIPVRFDTDKWPAQIISGNAPSGTALVTVTGIMLVEVRITPGTSQG